MLHEDIQHVVIRVDCPPEPVLLASDGDHDLVELPFVGRSGSVSTNAGGDLRSEPLAAYPDALIRDDNAPLGQQILDILRAYRWYAQTAVEMMGRGNRKPLRRDCETWLIMGDRHA